ncbi:mandelate racemase/muconate lactonizing enzyme family protein [Pigmentiphaga soli]|uniref:Mandelate racemase/muconate lactonizing enzyme family protein n=1 Tax=Pigmentiphaga soli TaxID=1007095 RepID=A0ABP8GDX1_9BURK
MRITHIEDFHVDGGWQSLSFLKIGCDEGLSGWAEFNESKGRRGLSDLIRSLGQTLAGQDPRDVGRIEALLYATTRPTAGGLQAHAIAAIVNACLDIKAKALGVPVYDLFGGAVRDRLPVYWSHCGTYRASHPDLFEKVIGKPALRSLDDVRQLGREVAAKGYRALKTNIILFDPGTARVHRAGFGTGPGHPQLNLDGAVLDGIKDLFGAFTEGAGEKTELMLDLNFNFRPAGLRRIAHALEPYNMGWMEADLYNPAALAAVRNGTTTPIGSLEAVLGRKALLPYLEHQSVDVAIMDVQWNGFAEAFKMAALAETYDVNVASHNSSGPLSNVVSSQFCALIPNFRILEIDVDHVPWLPDLLTHPYTIENGEFVLSRRPGWGTEINEDVARAHPAR